MENSCDDLMYKGLEGISKHTGTLIEDSYLMPPLFCSVGILIVYFVEGTLVSMKEG